VIRLAAVLAAAAALGAAAPVAHAAADPIPGCGPADVPGGDWPSYGGGYANSRTQSHEHAITAADAPTLTSAWTFSSQANGGAGDFTGTPTVAGGCMYVASTRGWVFAVNADSGKLVWKTKVPYGGGVNSSVTVAERTLPGAAARTVGRKKKAKAKTRRRKKRARAKHRAAAAPRTAGTLYVAVTRTQKGEGCPAGDVCKGPYVVALDQATGQVVWATPPIDEQPGADVYASPVVYDGVLMLGVSGGSAELGDEADRYAFQGSMNFLDADTGGVLKKTWTIHPPKQPDDQFAGAGIWSTPAIDPQDKVAFVGTANPFKPGAEHKYANSVVRFDVDPRSARFGQITGAYKGLIDEYLPAFSQLPCYDFPGNNPPYYPQGIGSCGDIDLDFGAAPNLFTDRSGRKLVGAGQKSGVYHVFDARTMQPVFKQIVGPPGSLGGIVGSTAMDGSAVYGPITVPGYVWSIDARSGSWRWLGPVLDGAHWGPPVSVANGVAYTVDFSGFLDAFDTRSGTLIAKRPLNLGGGGASLSWGGVSIARNTVYAAVGVVGLADGFVVALRAGGVADAVSDASQTNPAAGGGGGGGGGGAPAGPSIVSAPGAASTGYATPVMTTRVGGPLSYVNLDVVQHDVVSTDKAPDGAPLFRSKLIGLGESAPVEGLDRVRSGQSYSFFCSVHPGMRGTLFVQ
jgi:polyvinyl alcohol dehydrogenase (cytochrome)